MKPNKSIHTNNRRKKLKVSIASSDDRFRKPQLVFGKETDRSQEDEWDRLQQFDRDKHEVAKKAADDSKVIKQSAQWYEAYLSNYYGAEIRLDFVIVYLRPDRYTNITLGYHYK